MDEQKRLIISALAEFLESAGEDEKKGRIKLIKLTKQGTEVADNIENIKKIVG